MYIVDQISNALDLAVLRPTANNNDIRVACELVKANNIHTVCVAPVNVRQAVEMGVPVCAVIGFPHGTSTPAQKRNEAFAMMEAGAIELDVVINYGLLLAGNSDVVERELAAILDVARPRHCIVKAILESCFYPMGLLSEAVRFCADLGVDFVKTSTGFGLHGATPLAVKTMLKAVDGTDTQVKASGGINCYNDAAKYLDLGCTRLGASRFKELLP